MNNTATPVNNAIVPDQIQTIDGVIWFIIYNNGTYEAYRELPKVVEMNGKYFVKMGWNSDTHTVSYRETDKSMIAFDK
jgi:hypothetical protein